MARHYSPRAFMIEAPNKLLKEYYARDGLNGDIPWQHLSEKDIDFVFTAYENAPEPVRRRMDSDFRDIHNLADEGGIKTLIDVGQSKTDFISIFDGAEGHVERAFIAFLMHPEAFEEASYFHYADTLGRWRKRKRLPQMLKQPDDESKARLSKALSDYYRQKEGRGHGCDIEYYKRDERHYWFARPEDYAISALIYDEEHHLNKQTQRPAFEVIFVYSESECSLDIRAIGVKKTLLDIQTLWGRSILECELGDPPADSIVYELNALRNREFQFALEPEDGVSEVRVKRLRLKVMGSDHRITLEAPARRDPKEVYGLLERVLKGLEVSDDVLKVAGVGLQLVFPGTGTRRESTMMFDVSYPNSCSLRCEPKHEIAKNLLKRWKLDVSGDSQDGPGELGQPAQRIIRV